MTPLNLNQTFKLVLATLLSGLLGWWAARSGLAPLRTMKERAPATDAVVVEPFFGRPPDDPGVKDPALASPEPKTRLKLF
mgnify:CR=1 FL=1